MPEHKAPEPHRGGKLREAGELKGQIKKRRNAMYYTITNMDGRSEWTDHTSLAAAELFAHKVAEKDGYDCRVVQVLAEYQAQAEPEHCRDVVSTDAGLNRYLARDAWVDQGRI